MSEIHDSAAKRPGSRRPRYSPRVDLTAMVDLGFLLITFFMLVTMFTQMKSMQIHMPAAEKGEFPIKSDKLLTILLAKENLCFTYVGDKIDAAVRTDFSTNGIRSAIISRKEIIAKKFPEKPFLFVRVIPMPDCKYNNVIQALDEISICGVVSYAIIKPSEMDSLFLEGYQGEQ